MTLKLTAICFIALSIGILLSDLRVTAQVLNDPSSFKKYSYMAVLVSSQHPNAGKVATCFFVNDKSQMYLVAASHLFNCLDVFKGTHIPVVDQWDSVFITYYNDSLKKDDFFRISITEFKNSADPFFWYNKPDLICIKLPHIPHFKVNSIEKWLYAFDQKNGTPDKVFFWGYPADISQIKNRVYNSGEFKSSLYEGTFRGKIYQKIYIEDIKTYDTLNYLTTPNSDFGYSGSPVFFNFNDSKITTFGGIAFGSDSEKKMAWIVKPQLVIKAIETLKADAKAMYFIP